MKTLLSLVLIISSVLLTAQTHNLSVNNGYGSGQYEAGETVYVFSRELSYNEVFSGWDNISDLEISSNEGEWFFSFVMPAEDIEITALINILPDGFLQFEEIPTDDYNIPIYYAVPSIPKGTVFMFHGTGGSIEGWEGINKDQNFNILKMLYYNGFSVVVTECQESTLETDLNGDGKIRWHTYPIDTINNVEYIHQKVIIDSLTNRGIINRSKLFSMGMSAGGGFSTGFSVAFKSKANAVYCASGQEGVMNETLTPMLFCLMPNDATIGQEGNDEALANYNLLLNREMCTQYFMNTEFPIFPEYFMRIGIDNETSVNIFNEISNAGFIDSNNFFTGDQFAIQEDILSNPDNYPTFNSLNGLTKIAIANLVGVATGNHNFYANHNKRTIHFFEYLCDEPVINQEKTTNELIHIYPNPANDKLFIENMLQDETLFQIIDLSGKIIQQEMIKADNNIIDISHLSNGIYFLKSIGITQKFMIQK
jgi:hypothetical protein